MFGNCYYGDIHRRHIMLPWLHVLLLLLRCADGLVAWNKMLFPNPEENPEACGRPTASFVCDPQGIISKSQADELDRNVYETCNETTCACGTPCRAGCPGYGMSVAIVQKLLLSPSVVDSPTERQLEIERWAIYLRTVSWRFSSCLDDAVIVYSQQDNRVFTNTGRTTRKKLTNECVDNIFKESKQRFSGNIGETLIFMVEQYRSILNGGSCIDIKPVSTTQIAAVAVGSFAGLMVFFLAALTFISFCRNQFSSSSTEGAPRYDDTGWESDSVTENVPIMLTPQFTSSSIEGAPRYDDTGCESDSVTENVPINLRPGHFADNQLNTSAYVDKCFISF